MTLRSRPAAWLAIAALWTGTALASEADLPQAVKTREGCIFHTFPEYQVSTASWSGKCTPGEVIAGKGTLRYEAMYQDDNKDLAGKRVTVETGEFKAGRLDGPGQRTREYFTAEGRKFKDFTSTGTYVAGDLTGQGERVRNHYNGKTGEFYQRAQEKGQYLDDYPYGKLQRVLTSPDYRRFEKKVIDAEFNRGGTIRSGRVTFVKTALGGDIVLDDVRFKDDMSEDTITGSGANPEGGEVWGILQRPAKKLRIMLKAADLNDAGRFLNSFRMERDNWSAECVDAVRFSAHLVECRNGWIDVKEPRFTYDANLNINRHRPFGFGFADLDREDHPAPQLPLLLEREAREARQAREEAERTSVFSRSDFQNCIDLSREMDRMEADLKNRERELDDEESSLGTLRAMIEAAQANGFKMDVASYNSRANEYNRMLGAYERDQERLNERTKRFNDRCVRSGPVANSLFEEYCAGVDTHFCQTFR